MDRNPEPATAPPMARQRAAAFAVHLFTASGAGLALLAMLAAVDRRWPAMFAWLGIALVVDAVDGTLARRFRVREFAPRWSGDVLDLVVDILTYAFIPAYALVVSGLLPVDLAAPLGILIIVTSVLYFADTRMKSADNYFIGFPAVWNIVAFYLFLLQPPAWLAAAIVVTLAALTFVPIPFVHPFRVPRLQVVSLLLLGAWFMLAAIALTQDLVPSPLVVVGLCATGAYFLVAGALRSRI
jgi:phosphatidylcholine synthase